MGSVEKKDTRCPADERITERDYLINDQFKVDSGLFHRMKLKKVTSRS